MPTVAAHKPPDLFLSPSSSYSGKLGPYEMYFNPSQKEFCFIAFTLLEFRFFKTFFFFLLILPLGVCGAGCFPCLSCRHWPAGGTCVYLHVSSPHYVERICKIAYRLMYRRHSDSVWLWIFGWVASFVALLASQAAALTSLHCLLGGLECLWSDIQVILRIINPTGMLNVPLSHENKNSSQITANIPCLPKDPIFIGWFCGSPYPGPRKGKLSNY